MRRYLVWWQCIACCIHVVNTLPSAFPRLHQLPAQMCTESGKVQFSLNRGLVLVRFLPLVIAALPHLTVFQVALSVPPQHYQMLVRDMYAFYPLLIKYVDLHRSSWLKNPIVEPEYLYLCVAEVFNLWSKSNVRRPAITTVCFYCFLNNNDDNGSF